jgi:4-carboxymuconolactone decarboxylase
MASQIFYRPQQLRCVAVRTAAKGSCTVDKAACRVTPVEQSELTEEVAGALKGWAVRGKLNNIFLTLARHPALLLAWMPFGTHTFDGSTLEARQRELVILRTGWRCSSPYEFAHHVRISARVGVSDEDVQRVKAGPEAEGWTPHEAALMRAVDELEDRAVLSPGTWSTLTATYSTAEMLDLIYTFGAYRTTAAAMNSLGVELEANLVAPADMVPAGALGERA